MKSNLVNCNFSVSDYNETLYKVKIWLMHDGINFNKCSFTLDSIEDAKESCKNIPILAYIKTNEEGEVDFDEHNVITKLISTENGLQLSEYYLEKPIGVIPESNNFTIEQIDGANWVTVEGFIWKGYCNEGLEIIEKSSSKGVSMEIKVLEGFKEDDIYNITKFLFRGCTVLGDDVQPAMGTLARLEKFNAIDYSKDVANFNKLLLENLRKEDKALSIKETVNEEVEVFNCDDNSINNIEENQEPTTDEPTVIEGEEIEPKVEDTTDEPKEEDATDVKDFTTDNVEDTTTKVEEEPTKEDEEDTTENVDFNISYDVLLDLVENELSSYVTLINDWGEEYEVRRYWTRTILPFEKIVIVEDREDNWNTYGVPFTLDKDKAILDFDSKVEYIPVWRVKEADEKVEVSTFKFKEDIQKFTETVDKLKNEIASLEEFKTNVELQNLKEEIETILEDFNFSVEEISDVKAKAMNKEIDLEMFKKELFALEGMKAFKNRKQFSTTKTEKEVVKVAKAVADDVNPYGDLVKYLK